MKPAVLLVDDEQSICSALSRTFSRHHYRVLSANSGEQALALLKSNPIDVVISDQRMPGMSGTELLSQVHNMYPQTRRIILSGHSDFNDLTAAINEAHINRFIPKPWDDEQLVNIVDSIVPFPSTQQTLPMPLQSSARQVQPTEAALLSLSEGFFQKQLQLEEAIKNDALTLDIKHYQPARAGEEGLQYFRIQWPQYTRFQHEGIVNIANESGYTGELFRWYLINILQHFEQNPERSPFAVDLFIDQYQRDLLNIKLLQQLLSRGVKVTFRVAFEFLTQTQFGDFLTMLYQENSQLMLNLGKRVIDVNTLESTPVRYLEMDSKPASLHNSLLTEKRLKMLADADNLAIKTILSDTIEKNQRHYAQTMGFDLY